VLQRLFGVFEHVARLCDCSHIEHPPTLNRTPRGGSGQEIPVDIG
jgi:hypothetical protein